MFCRKKGRLGMERWNYLATKTIVSKLPLLNVAGIIGNHFLNKHSNGCKRVAIGGTVENYNSRNS